MAVLEGIPEDRDKDGGSGSSSSSSLDSSSSLGSDSKDEKRPANKVSAITLVKSTTQWGMEKALAKLNSRADRNAYIDMAKKYGDTEFYNNVLAAAKILPFAIMFESNHLAVLHSVGLYHRLRDAKGKNGLYGFLGEVKRTSYPAAILIKKIWLSTKSAKHGPVNPDKIYEQVQTDPKTLWNGLESLDPSLKAQRTTPFMILLFPQLAEFLRSHTRTPLEALKWLGQFIAENDDLSQEDVKVYINYFEMAACTKKSAGGDSLMALDCRLNLNPSKKFEDWSEK